MNAKRTLVSILLIASVLFLATAAVSAADVSDLTVSVDDGATSVIAGDTIEVDVWFTAIGDESDVRLKLTLEGDKDDVVVNKIFDVEDGVTYHKTLVLKVPFEFDDEELSRDVILNLKLLDADEDYELNVQRPSYDFSIKSVSVDNTVSAGRSLPVEVVLKNVGYNDADDIYVTVSIPELNIHKSVYFGDIVTGFTESESEDDDETDTMSGKLNLEVPYTAKAGVYTLVVEVKNDETESTAAKEIVIENSEIAVKTGNSLILLNPTSKPMVYKVMYNSNEKIVDVAALSSKTVAIDVPNEDYNFDVMVYSGAVLLSTVNFSGSAAQIADMQLTNPVFVLTVILAIVFLVLLVVLVVLITKKPQKTEEFGESYY